MLRTFCALLQSLRIFTFLPKKIHAVFRIWFDSGNSKLIQDLKRVANPGDNLRMKRGPLLSMAKLKENCATDVEKSKTGKWQALTMRKCK